MRDNQHYSVQVSGNLRANDMGILSRTAINHHGIVRLPCDLANPLIAKGLLEVVLPEYHSPSNALWAVYLSRSYQIPVVRQFIDFIAESWKENMTA